MPLINTSVSNLIQGVSQQADATRFSGQCEEQENALSSVAGGLKKRPNTRHVGKLLDTEITDNSFVHFINRSDEEKYCLTQDGNIIQAHNALTGAKCSIIEQETSDFTINNNEVNTVGTYLETTDARKNIKPLTIGDTTFLLNTIKETALDPTEQTDDLNSEALIFIKQGDYKKKYGFKIEGRNRLGGGNMARVAVGTVPKYVVGVGNVFALTQGAVWSYRPNWVLEGGSGFAVNDIVNITLVGQGDVDVYFSDGPDSDEQGDFDQTVTKFLTLHEQPTLKVLTVDEDGAILTASIEDGGAFDYYTTSPTGYSNLGASFYQNPYVASSNNTFTDSVGTDAIINIKQQLNYGANWGSFGYNYVELNAANFMSDTQIVNGGSGFAVGDILDVADLPESRPWSAYPCNFPPADDFSLSPIYEAGALPSETNFLNMHTVPQVRVTSIDANGSILTLAIEEIGRFGYGDYAGTGWIAVDDCLGGQENGFFGSIRLLTTNNTAVDVTLDDSFSGERTVTSGGGTDGSSTDSAAILGLLATGTNANININFDTDASHIDSNLLIIKPKLLASGLPTTQYYQITPIDGLAGEGIGVVHREVSSMFDLPLVAVHGFKVKVVGDAELGQDDFYCKFNLTNEEAVDGEVGQGTWIECAGAKIADTIDETTMPRLLVNVAENVFQIRRMSFGTLKAGDENSNPPPSFINNTINNIFQYKNRLGFLCQDAVIMSESGFGGFDAALARQSFNFFRTTVTSLIDSDPIDVTVASQRVTNLQAAQGFQENLVLFSSNGQFVLKGGALLTPSTVSINPITNFSFEDQVEPLPLGSYIYFPFTRGSFTGVREFVVNASNDTYDAVEITEHVPAYIPKDIIDMAGTTSEDIIVLLSREEKGALYIYSYFWNNNQKVLSAWSKFTFSGEIRGIDFIESTLYLVTVNNGETHMVTMPLESGLSDSSGFVTHLDMRVSKTITNGSDTIDLSENYTPEDNSIQVYTENGLRLGATNSGATVTLNQAVSADTPVFVGIPYTMKYTFSEQIFKAKAGNSTSPSNAAKLMVRNGSIFFDNTAYFKVKVTPQERQTYENTFTSNLVGLTDIGSLALEDGFYRFPVFTKAQDTVITIENDSALPSNFQSAEFESFVNPRSTRYG